jgi:peroxiredoxin
MFNERRIANLGLVAAVAILGSSVMLLLGAKDDPHADSFRAQAGMPAPAVKIQDTDGHNVNLNEKGHLTVLCFGSADQSAGRLKKIIEEASPKEDATDIATGEINVTAGPVPEPQFVTLSDQEGVVASRFNVHANPTFFVIDEDGLIRYRGVFDSEKPEYKLAENYLTSAVRTFGDKKQVTVAWVEGRGK